PSLGLLQSSARIAQYLLKFCVECHGRDAEIPAGDVVSFTQCVAFNLSRLVGKSETTERLGKDEFGSDSSVSQTTRERLRKHAWNCFSFSAMLHRVGELAHVEKSLRQLEMGAYKIVLCPILRGQSEQLICARFGLREFSPDHVAKTESPDRFTQPR